MKKGRKLMPAALPYLSLLFNANSLAITQMASIWIFFVLEAMWFLSVADLHRDRGLDSFSGGGERMGRSDPTHAAIRLRHEWGTRLG
jgi:hypothetical protein